MNVKYKRLLLLGWLAAGFTGAGAGSALAQVKVERVAAGLENPWAVAFLPAQRFLVTERAGRLRVVGADGHIGAPVAGLPAIAAGG